MSVKEYVNQALDPTELAALYAESADEDISLAEEGLHDYAEQLAAEDSA